MKKDLTMVLKKVKKRTKIKNSTKFIQEVKMTEETEFEMDEEKALKQGFAEARAKGKLFNLNTWKRQREEQRAKLNED